MGIVDSIKAMTVNALGLKSLKKPTQAIRDSANALLTPQKATRKETFEEALERMNLTEEDIQKRTSEFKKLSMIFASLSILVFFYFIYALIQKAMIASLGSLGIMCVLLAQLFRYNFWLFQIRKRRLGCTFKEWFNDLIGKKS